MTSKLFMSIFTNKKLLLFSLLSLILPSSVFGQNLNFSFFGHGNFLIKGGGQSVLINPFIPTGCASNLREPKDIKADFVLASSRLADEGYNPSKKLMFVDPGNYKYEKTIINGLSVPHDRFQGRRFGMASLWIWNQNNIKIVHMSGAAAKINIKDQILLSRPDILFISIGGGAKSYDGKEASEIIKKLKPTIVIPVHYLKNAKFAEDCDFSNSDLFLENMPDFKVKYVRKNLKIGKKDLKEKVIYFFSN